VIDIIGWIGSLLLGASAIPQAVTCYRTKSGKGLDWTFLLMWLFGEVALLIYVWSRADLPLILNYVINLTCLSIMLFYKVRETYA
jgi:uncharacterized protein with PQ loop repeat